MIVFPTSHLIATFGSKAKAADAIKISRSYMSELPENLPTSVIGQVAITQPAFFMKWLKEAIKPAKTPKEAA